MNARAVIYDRVSSAQQARGYSLTTQLDACRRYCESRGYDVVGEYEDRFSGMQYERPSLNDLFDEIASLHPDVVVAYDVDRLLGREVFGQAMIKRMLEDAGVRAEYVLGGGSGTEDGELQEDFKALWARHENRQRIERSRRGKRGRAQAGFVLMMGKRTPYGFDYESEPHKGWFVINDTEAAVVREMYDWLLVEGLTCYRIAQLLTEREVLTRGDTNPVVVKEAGRACWCPSTVARMLKNPLYKGEWYYGKTRRTKRNGRTLQVKNDPSEWVKVDVPAIIDPERWAQAQERLVENQRRASRNTKRAYLLRGMIFCSCGRRWCGRWKGKPRKYGYYRCPSTEREPWRQACDVRFSIPQYELEDAVWHAVTDFLLDPEALIVEIRRQREEQLALVAQHEQRERAVSVAIADIDRKLAQLLDQVLDGFPAAIISAKRRELTAQRDELVTEQRRLDALRSEQVITPEVERELAQLADVVRQALPEMTFDEKRQLLDILKVRVDVIDRDHVRVSGLIRDAVVNTSSE